MNTPESENIDAVVADYRQFSRDLANTSGRADLANEIDAVSGIVESLADDPTLINAACLNPLLREKLLDLDGGQQKFSPTLIEFCLQLQALTRLTHSNDGVLRAKTSAEQAERLRRLLLAVVNDTRLMLIHLATILYQLRNAKTESEERQRRIADEVRMLYGPLANRLGVWQLKWELEDLSFRFLQPEEYHRLAQALQSRRVDREQYLDEVNKTLRDELAIEGIKAELSSRPKHIYSIYRKLQKKQISLESLADLRAVRILVDDITSCYSSLGVVHRLWSYLPHEFDDYIANPKGNYYRSLHTAVVGPKGLTIEVQIRTYDMHAHAELGVAAHWRYKEGGGNEPVFEQKIRWLRQLLEPVESSLRSEDFLDEVREEMLEDRVYAISPRGDIVDLPRGATPLDFAYHVHTQIGHRCRGAKVNGRIVTLTTQLTNGDQVEIITGKNAQPSRDWLIPRLGFLAASRSRAKVRAWYRQQDSGQHRKQGRELLERELNRLNARDVDLQDICKQLKTESPDKLYIALGAGDLTVAAIATALQNLKHSPETMPLSVKRKSPHHAAADSKTSVSGIGDMMSQLARCCRPLPPDSIGGYITQGRGISIHRKKCGNYKRLAGENPERLISVNWNTQIESRYVAELKIVAANQPGMLRDIGTILADEAIFMIDCDTKTQRQSGEATLQMKVDVKDLATLGQALSRIDALPFVLAVSRQ